MKNFNLKKFITATLVLLLVLLGFDMIWDKITGKFELNEIFAMKNLVFKILAALVGAYFYATYKTEEEA
jgi:uncharacterized membrane protein